MTAPLTAWRDALGDEWVVVDPAELAAAERATFATARKVSAILRPASTDEVASCLRIAQAHGARLHPVSRGRNWGYGSRVPPCEGCALLDLSRMDHVLGFDDRLGTLTVEPGVTFAQAHAHLEAAGSRFFIATIGGPPDGSLLANALERGDGAGPHGDVFAHVCGLEVVLPTGEILRTGHARFDGAHTATAFRWGAGPVLDGLFSQSNLGVVTRMTFQLARLPEAYCELFASVETDGLPTLVETTRELYLEGTLRGTFSLWNDYKAFSKLFRYPFDLIGGVTPLPDWAHEKIRSGFFGGKWNLTGAIHAATPALLEAARARVESVLAPLASKLLFRDGPEVHASRALGRPSAENLSMAYWRKRAPMPESPDLDRDGCGLLWCACAVPLLGERVAEAAAISERVPKAFGFEPNVSLLGISDRCGYLVTLLAYDREVDGEDEKALACHESLLREMAQSGFPPSRLGIQAMRPPLAPNDDSESVLARLKRAVDPGAILSPGRYGID